MLHKPRHDENEKMNTVLITGASSGIGEATARYFLEKGWRVFAAMIDPATSPLPASEHLHILRLDVRDERGIEHAIAEALKIGPIDVLVNNAGYGLLGPAESFSQDALERQLGTNVIGLMLVTKEVLSHMRERRTGTIINISSMMGRISFPMFSSYVATKWAVEGFSESLVFETGPYGIRVKIIEPGAIKTRFFDRAEVLPAKAPYDDRWNEIWRDASSRGNGGADPMVVARTIYRAANDRSSRLRFPVGPLARILLCLRAVLPLPLFQFILNRSVK